MEQRDHTEPVTRRRGRWPAPVAGVVLRTLSFRYAWRGVWVARTGSNFRVQLAGAAAALALAGAYGVRRSHLGLVILSIVAVLSAELVNTAIERICDLVAELHGLGWDARIRDIKDLAAAAVLIVCLGAVAIAVVVFALG